MSDNLSNNEIDNVAKVSKNKNNIILSYNGFV